MVYDTSIEVRICYVYNNTKRESIAAVYILYDIPNYYNETYCSHPKNLVIDDCDDTC